MRKIAVLFLFIFFCGVLNAAVSPATLKFHSPSFAEPFYRIHIAFEVKGNMVNIQDLLLNGAKPGLFLIFKDGKNVPVNQALEDDAYDIVLDYAWAAGKDYRVTLIFQSENSKKPKKQEMLGQSPAEGGIPGGQEGFYRIYQVEEQAGLERNQEIMTLTLTAPKPDVEKADFIAFDGPRLVPIDIIEKNESIPPPQVSSSNPVTLTYKMAMPLDAKANEKKLLLILKGEKSAGPANHFSVTGEGLGRTVRGSKLALEFHPQSGQINTIESLEAGVKLFNKAGVIHWNPDVFVPGVAWDHSFDWNPPAVFEEKSGAYLYFNSRRGPLPRVQGITLEVKYTVEADAPYFISETRLNFESGQGVIAVRNDEMVLFKELFDHFVYKDKKGNIIKIPLKEKERTPFGLVHVAPEDLDWVGLINSKEGFGFFSLRLESANGNFEIPGQFSHKPGTYFYAPSDGNYVYWVRPLIYTWGDYFTNNLFTYVPKGSFFYERNAYIVLRLGEDFAQYIERLQQKLNIPLRVF
jgi:hypothetical protein